MRAVSGSSPLTRGKLSSRSAGSTRGRLIPAHAGKTTGKNGHSHKYRAHPRSRGENAFALDRVGAQVGSSLLMRGKRSPIYPAGHARGLIPTHAGKT